MHRVLRIPIKLNLYCYYIMYNRSHIISYKIMLFTNYVIQQLACVLLIIIIKGYLY